MGVHAVNLMLVAAARSILWFRRDNSAAAEAPPAAPSAAATAAAAAADAFEILHTKTAAAILWIRLAAATVSLLGSS